MRILVRIRDRNRVAFKLTLVVWWKTMITYIIHDSEDDHIVGKIIKHDNGRYESQCLVDKDDHNYP